MKDAALDEEEPGQVELVRSSLEHHQDFTGHSAWKDCLHRHGPTVTLSSCSSGASRMDDDIVSCTSRFSTPPPD